MVFGLFKSQQQKEDDLRRANKEYRALLLRDPVVRRKMLECQATSRLKNKHCTAVVLAAKSFDAFTSDTTPEGRCHYIEGRGNFSFYDDIYRKEGLEGVKRQILRGIPGQGPRRFGDYCAPSEFRHRAKNQAGIRQAEKRLDKAHRGVYGR